MATTTPPGKLTGISPKAYEHPADRAATAALKSIPMLELGPRQLPDVWATYLEVLDVLDMPDVYDLYVTNTPITNAMALGAGKPIIVVDSGLLNLLDASELQTVLAHEVG